ncbi:MAG: hypothetical protein AB7F86_16935 [Bdellovibrionales bacterium]
MLANFWPSPIKTSERWLGFDVIRWMAFYAILIFHVSYALWAPAGLNARPVNSFWILWLEWPARVFAFGGFVVLSISFFLYGVHGSRKSKWLAPMIVALGGVWIVLASEPPFYWDIYGFLTASLAVITLAKVLKLPATGMTWIGFVILSVPFWEAAPLIHVAPWLKAALVGYCSDGISAGEWPLLPWIGLPIFSFGLGRMTATMDLNVWRKKEIWAWLPLLALGLPGLGRYYFTPLGADYGCFAFRQSPYVFWSHMIWMIFTLRLSLLGPLKRFLQRRRWARWMSASPINRYFIFVYFAHYLVIVALARLATHFQVEHSPLTFMAIVLFLFAALEFLMNNETWNGQRPT